MNQHYTWKEYKQGYPLPADALLLGHYEKDGPLYVGRRWQNDEVGKITVFNDSSKMNELWTHSQKKSTSGEILCGSPDRVFWKSYDKGDPIPDGAIKAGHFHKDGVLFIGKQANGEIGKVNTSDEKLYNLWSPDCNRSESGYILCEVRVVKFVYNFVPLLEVKGQSGGFVEMKFIVESGYSGPQKETETLKEISAQAYANFVALSDLLTRQKEEMKGILELKEGKELTEHKVYVELSKTCYIYQSEVLASMNDGKSLTFKVHGIFQCQHPIANKQFEVNNPT